MIKVKHKGNFLRTTRYFERLRKPINVKALEKYAIRAVKALEAATPVDTGLTAKSWYYKIVDSNGRVTISFNNSNIQNKVPIAIILFYGHGTRNGGWVEGRDYINPAIQPIFDQIAKDAWKEVTRL